MNTLLPLIQVSDAREGTVESSTDDYFIDQVHFNRCIDLLNDLQRGSINMTLLPSPSYQSQDRFEHSSSAGTVASSSLSLATLIRLSLRRYSRYA